MPWIYSTFTNATKYCDWSEPASPNTLPIILRSLVVRGGAGLPAKKTLITPFGVGTQVTDAELDWLNDNTQFKQHIAAGFIKTLAIAHKNPDDVVYDMSQRDGSSPIVPSDYGVNKAPTAGSATAEPTTRERTRFGNQSGFR